MRRLCCDQAATQHLQDERRRLQQQRNLRKANLEAVPPLESDLRKLDASVKRNTALIKKLRSISEESKASLLEDILRTNQIKVLGAAPDAYPSDMHGSCRDLFVICLNSCQMAVLTLCAAVCQRSSSCCG
jgi:hypothetical protein